MYIFTMAIIFASILFTTLMLISSRRKVIFSLLSMTGWFVSAGLTSVMYVPYQLYNSADNAVATGIQEVTVQSPAASYICIGFGAASLLWFFILLIDKISNRKVVPR